MEIIEVMPRHYIILIPGLGNTEMPLKLLVFWWKLVGFTPIVYPIRWHDGAPFGDKLALLMETIDMLALSGRVSLVGTSAGGSAALNAFMVRKDVVYRVATVCSRLHFGDATWFRSFALRAASSPAFRESIELIEKSIDTFSKNDRKRILTIQAKFGDELVPDNTAVIGGAHNITLPTIEHMVSIAAALTIFSQRIFEFLKVTKDGGQSRG